jgi:hypothetical protein
VGKAQVVTRSHWVRPSPKVRGHLAVLGDLGVPSVSGEETFRVVGAKSGVGNAVFGAALIPKSRERGAESGSTSHVGQ